MKRKKREHGDLAMYRNGKCRCVACRAANAADCARHNARRSIRAASGDMPDDVTHGFSTASNWKCKCDICTESVRQKNIILAERIRSGDVAHSRGGALSGCPCEPCKRGSLARLKARNDASVPGAHRNGMMWTGPELEIVSRRDLTQRQAAEMLGRTISAVATRRTLIGRDPRQGALLGSTASN